ALGLPGRGPGPCRVRDLRGVPRDRLGQGNPRLDRHDRDLGPERRSTRKGGAEMMRLAAVLAILCALQQEKPPKSYRLPSTDLKQQVIWGSQLEVPGSSLA